MIAPKRNVRRRLRIKKLFVLCLGIVVCAVLGFFLSERFNVRDRLMGVSIVSPIPTFNAKGGFSLFSKSPKEEITSNLSKAGVDFEEIYEASNSAYIIQQKDGKEIYMTSQKDMKLQVATLQLILSRLTIEGKNFSRLDLRFDKPVIVLK